jgi:outer membrane lipoprotein-sorting protein
MRRTILLVATLTLLVLPAMAEDLTLDQVLAKHYEALGGLDAIKGMQSATFVGRMEMGPGAEAPFKMYFKRPMKARMEFTMQGMTGIQAYDGETAWMIMPFMGKSDPEVMADDQAKNMREQADIDGPLVDWQEKGHKVELLGLEDVDGTEAYKIKVDLANGDVRTQYLDSEYFITIKQEGKTTMQGNEVEFETILSDYKEVGGLMFPHSIESRQKGAPSGQVITIDEIEVDVEVSDDLFEMPAPAEEEAAE